MIGKGRKQWIKIGVIAAIFVLIFFALPLALGQKPDTASALQYDLAKEVRIKGVVEEVKDFQCPVSGGMGAHLIVKISGARKVMVHLALSKFLKDYDFGFAKGDEVEVLGVMAKIGDEEGMLARRIERGNQAFTFRDKNGKPLW